MKKLTITDIRNNEYHCIICNTKFKPKPGTYGLFCSLPCSSSRERTSKVELNYNKNPKKCKKCNQVIPYKQRENNFCSRSCSASISNLGI